MIRVSQSLASELNELKIRNQPGAIPFEVAFFHWADRFLCVNVPQGQADAAFREIASRTPESVIEGAYASEIIHDLLGVPDDAIAYLVNLPDRSGIPKELAELRQDQNFTTRESVWNEPAPAAPAAPEAPPEEPPAAGSELLRELRDADLELDDMGNPIPPDLGDLDMGEHDA